jgi:Co/Zn/Cd efflux system component
VDRVDGQHRSRRAAAAVSESLRAWPFLQNPAVTILAESHRTARRVALIGMAVSAMLACSNIIIGLLTNSTSVVATGFEFAGDVLASSGGSGYR